MDHENIDQMREKLIELIKDSKIGMFVTMTDDGKHVSRPMGMQEIDTEGNLWFFTYGDSSKMAQIANNPNVNIAISNEGSNSWVSLSGIASEVQDMRKAEELWNPLMKAWFPEGLETAGLTLIKVTLDSGEYWDSPNSKAIQLFGMAKAAITGQPPKAGDNETVEI